MESTAMLSDGTVIEELDVVRLLVPIVTDEGTVPAGQRGTVVHIYCGGKAFEVEFAAPFHVVTVLPEAVERLPISVGATNLLSSPRVKAGVTRNDDTA